MSAELVIIPIALAFFAAKAARELQQSQGKADGDIYAWRVTTIIADQQLLNAALREVGLEAQWRGENASLVVGGWRVGLLKEAGRYTVLLEAGITKDEAMRFATDLEAAYTRCVQADVLTRIQTQAPTLGLTVTDVQRNQDTSVTVTLEVNAT